MQRQMKQRRFKDLDCSFVHKLIQQPNLVNNLVNRYGIFDEESLNKWMISMHIMPLSNLKAEHVQ